MKRTPQRESMMATFTCAVHDFGPIDACKVFEGHLAHQQTIQLWVPNAAQWK